MHRYSVRLSLGLWVVCNFRRVIGVQLWSVQKNSILKCALVHFYPEHIKAPLNQVLDITKMYIFTVIFPNIIKHLLYCFPVLQKCITIMYIFTVIFANV